MAYDDNKLTDEQARAVKGLYISSLVFAGIALLGKLLYLATGSADTMEKFKANLVNASRGFGGGLGGPVDRIVNVAFDGALTIAVVLLAVAISIQNHVLIK